MATDARIFSIASALLACAEERLAETPGGVPDRACVITGPIAWDNCTCGQLIVAIGTSYTSSNFPTPSSTTAGSFGAGRCGEPIIAYTLTVSMLRCVPISDSQGNPPSCEALSASALGAVLDASAVRDGILCCLSDMIRQKDENGTSIITGFTTSNQDFVTGGMCGGSTMAITVGVLNRCPCED
jgi:hypothetical protein